jgi:hypothetical protein
MWVRASCHLSPCQGSFSHVYPTGAILVPLEWSKTAWAGRIAADVEANMELQEEKEKKRRAAAG